MLQCDRSNAVAIVGVWGMNTDVTFDRFPHSNRPRAIWARSAATQRLRAASGGPLVGVASSRLGRDPRFHFRVCQFLSRSVRRIREIRGQALIALGSAIEPWARRACELDQVPYLTVSVEPQRRADLNILSSEKPLSRDRVLIDLAEQLDVVYVRRNGVIAESLLQRIRAREDATTRVAVTLADQCAAADLIRRGAVGWFLSPNEPPPTETPFEPAVEVAHAPNPTNPHPSEGSAWTKQAGQWLVHCTRSCLGPWPGETWRQYRDSMLVGHATARRRTALDALHRIVASGRLKRSAHTTRKSTPVVCFSANALDELLSRRCFRRHLGRWDYEPYGVAIRMSAAIRLGIQPVIYGPPKQRIDLATEDQYRFQPIGTSYDWRREREWRSRRSIDLAQLPDDEVRVFVQTQHEVSRIGRCCRWPIVAVRRD